VPRLQPPPQPLSPPPTQLRALRVELKLQKGVMTWIKNQTCMKDKQ
jgi:hypothetical protein